ADGTAIALDPKPGPGSRTVPAGRQPRFAGGPVLGQTLRPAGGIWGVVACFGPLAGHCDGGSNFSRWSTPTASSEGRRCGALCPKHRCRACSKPYQDQDNLVENDTR